MSERIDVDAIFDSLDPSLADPGFDPWGGANLARPMEEEQ